MLAARCLSSSGTQHKVLIFEKEGDEMLDKLREKYPKAGVAGVD